MPPRGSSPVARRAVSLPWRGLVARSPLKCMARNARWNFPNKIHHAVSMQDSYWCGVRPRHRARPPAPQRRNAACRSRPRRPACESALHDGGKGGGRWGLARCPVFWASLCALPKAACEPTTSRPVSATSRYEPTSQSSEPRALLFSTGNYALGTGHLPWGTIAYTHHSTRAVMAVPPAPPTRRQRAAYAPPTCRLRAAYVPPIICYVPLRSGSEDFRFRTLRGRHVAARSK